MISCISSILARDLQLKIDYDDCHIYQAANQTLLVSHGTTVVSVENQPHPFVVIDNLSAPLLVGTDWLSRRDAKLDFACDGRLLLDGKEYPFISCTPRGVTSIGTVNSPAHSAPCGGLFTSKRYRLPPFSERLVRVHFSGRFPPHDKIPLYCQPISQAPFHVAHGIASIRQLITQPFVLIANLSPRTIRIRRSKQVAAIVPAPADIDTVSPDMRANDRLFAETTSELSEEQLLNQLDAAIDPQLPPEQHQLLKTLLQKNLDVFAKNPKSPGVAKTTGHRIDTGNEAPVRNRAYRVGNQATQTIEQRVTELKDHDLIEPSQSDWASPVVLVRKKDGELRFCVDYRKINAKTKKDAYPLPRIDDLLDALGGSQYFSSLDLAAGYWQIPIHESDREKTAFITPSGLYQFKVMPFGLSNAPATFQRIMDALLSGIKWQRCLVYMDDVIVFARTFEEHLESLQLVFDKLREAGLHLKASKCKFARPSLPFLGHVVSREGIHTCPDKTHAIQQLQAPTNIRELRTFLGMCSYYRRFIDHFADLAEPLHALLRKPTANFVWSAKEELAFRTLKEKLAEPPILQFPDNRRPFTVDTDASNYGLGAVLSQLGDDGQLHPICFASRSLSPAERNYHTTERECLGVVFGVSTFHPYLWGTQFTIRTDHAALTSLLTTKEPQGRLARWVLLLQGYTFDILHRPGTSMGHADGLSRLPPIHTIGTVSPTADDEQPTSDTDPQVLNATPATHTDVRQAQRADPEFGLLIQYLESKTLPPDDQLAARILRYAPLYVIDPWTQKLYYRKPGHRRRLVIPAPLRSMILHSAHENRWAAHAGISRTISHLSARYFWPNMTRDITSHIESCEQCQKTKRPRRAPRGLLTPFGASRPFELLSMDFLGPFDTSPRGNKYLLVVIDHFTRWPEAIPTVDCTSDSVAYALSLHILARFGFPRRILTDGGTHFNSQSLKAIFASIGAKHLKTSAYHPQTNGMTERFNNTILQGLRKLCADARSNWDMAIGPVLFAYRNSVHAATGYEPALLLYGQPLVTPTDHAVAEVSFLVHSNSTAEYKKMLTESITQIRATAHQNAQAVRDQRAEDANRTRTEPNTLRPGDLVLRDDSLRAERGCQKLRSPYTGPYIVVSSPAPNVYRLRRPDGRHEKALVNISRLKLQTRRRRYVPIPDDVDDHMVEGPTTVPTTGFLPTAPVFSTPPISRPVTSEQAVQVSRPSTPVTTAPESTSYLTATQSPHPKRRQHKRLHKQQPSAPNPTNLDQDSPAQTRRGRLIRKPHLWEPQISFRSKR